MTPAQFLENLWSLILALLRYNVVLTALAILLAFPFASLLALGRLSRHRAVAYPVAAYINLLRSSPLLMVLFWTYYTFPMLLGGVGGLSVFYAALVALTAFEAAYFAEIIRAGIQSIHRDQRLAALATGLKPWQVSLYVIWPQAVHRMIPSLLTQSIIAFQDSTLASIIGLREVAQTTTIINSAQVRPIWMYSILAGLYLVLCLTLSQGVRRIERRTAKLLAV
ncbi:MAG: amino acid ABC transporter permease [Candidatus Rokubacteria bacterium]|nr:amino acid ABC transporter permease [Candidatus Rokubacteria bacterium]